MVIALGVTWVGFLVVSWGRHMLAGDKVGIVDLAVPGHYSAHSGAQFGNPLGLVPGGSGIPGLQGGPPLVNGQIVPTSGGGGGKVTRL